MRSTPFAVAALLVPTLAAAQPADPAGAPAPPADAAVAPEPPPAATPPPPAEPPAEPPATAPEPPPAEPAKAAVEVHGFGSFALTHAFSRPADHRVPLRVFDGKEDTLTVDAVEVSALRATKSKGDVGFRADLVAGSSLPAVEASAGLFRDASGAGFDIDLQQAYGSWRPSDTVVVDVGKFVTPTGYEVIEGWDGWNDNYSRSILFGYAIPFTHTGARVAATFGDVTATAYLVNGWDNAIDDNVGKTGALNALYVHGALTAAATVMSGKETTGWRTLIDAVASYKVGDKLVLGLNGDFATADLGDASATWYGVAGYANATVNDRLTLGVRGEWFDDADGARTGVAQALVEGTATATVHLAGGAHARAEFRVDHSDQPTLGDSADPSQTQATLAVNLLAAF